MKQLMIFIASMIVQIPFGLTAFSYDGFLSKYLNPVDYSSDEMRDYRKSMGDQSIAPWGWGTGSQSLLITDNEPNPLYGIYFSQLTEGDPESGPFIHAFGKFYTLENKFYVKFLNYRNEPEKFPSFVDQLRTLNLSVLELYDAKVLSGEFDLLSQLDTLRILGLPRTGVAFSEIKSLPQSIQVLVVRNSRLDDEFFNIINKLPNLRELILSGCYLDYGRPRINTYTFYEESWSDFPPLFENVSKRLTRVNIVNSDPTIFEHMVPYRWENLESLTVMTDPCLDDMTWSAVLEYIIDFNEKVAGEGTSNELFPKIEKLKFNVKNSESSQVFTELVHKAFKDRWEEIEAEGIVNE